MKVIHVVEATTAGVGRYVTCLCRCMQNAGLTVRVACPLVRSNAERDTDFVNRLAAIGVPVDPVPMRRSLSPYSDLRAWLLLRQLVREHTPDVVHVHSSKAGALGRLAARNSGPAVVYTPNAFGYLGLPNGAVRRLFRQVERWLGYHATDALICVSRSELELARRQDIAPDGKLALVENAIAAADFGRLPEKAAARTELGLDPKRPLVGAVGRLAAQKGFSDLVKAARRIVDESPDVQFVLVGEGEYQRKLQRMIVDNDLQERVILTGFRADVRPVLAALDVFVLPSLYEGMSYSLMEAMAAGLPVVATNVVGNRDLVVHGESGLLVPPSDPPALSGALLRLLNDPTLRERLGKGAREAARSRPSPRQMADQVMELYRSVLSNRRDG